MGKSYVSGEDAISEMGGSTRTITVYSGAIIYSIQRGVQVSCRLLSPEWMKSIGGILEESHTQRSQEFRKPNQVVMQNDHVCMKIVNT